MGQIILYDACVLYSAPLRDLFIRLSLRRVVQARWTDRILDEVFRNILAQRSDLRPEQLARTRVLMNAALPDARVEGFEHLESGLVLPDVDDLHVLAGAIHAGAGTIVTSNLKDFPAERLLPHHVEAVSPDEFVLSLLERALGLVLAAVEDQAAALRQPPVTIQELLATLQRCGLVRSVARIHDLMRD